MKILQDIQQMKQMLTNAKGWLEKARAHLLDEEQPEKALIEARLFEDMFAFPRQIQAATDTAKFAAARLSGKEAPSWEDDESSIEELVARLDKAIDYLEGFEEADFEGWQQRKITLPFAPQMYSPGEDYFRQFAQPNFYFHITTAYGIMRHLGVEVGKRDYIGFMEMKPLAEG